MGYLTKIKSILNKSALICKKKSRMFKPHRKVLAKGAHGGGNNFLKNLVKLCYAPTEGERPNNLIMTGQGLPKPITVTVVYICGFSIYRFFFMSDV